MSATHLDVHVPAQLETPRVAIFLGRLIDTWQAYARARRAQRDLRQRARDAQAVHALARGYERVQPNLAAELHCLAERHV